PLAAEGEKPRHGARLLLAAVAGVAGESTPGPQLALPFRSPAAFVVASGPSSLFPLVGLPLSPLLQQPFDPHYGGSVKMHPAGLRHSRGPRPNPVAKPGRHVQTGPGAGEGFPRGSPATRPGAGRVD